MNKLFTLLLLAVTLTSNAQIIPEIEWQKCLGSEYDDSAGGITPTPDGGYLAYGYVTELSGNVTSYYESGDYWIAKMDENGQLQWSKNYGGNDYEGSGFLRFETSKVKPTPDGGYILGGSTMSIDGDVSSNFGGSDVWLVKINEAGEIQWEQNYGSEGDDDFTNLEVTADGGFIITAATSNWNNYVFGSTITKTDVLGNVEWSNSYGAGEWKISTLYGITQTADGGYIATGWTNAEDSETTPAHEIFPGFFNASRLWVIKIEPTGEFQWAKSYGGSNIDEGYAVVQDSDGNYLITGMTYSGDGDVVGHPDPDNIPTAWILKLDGTGEIIWQHCYGQRSNALHTEVMPSGDYVIGGSFYVSINSVNNTNINTAGGTDQFLMRLNAQDGSIVWVKTMGGSQNDNLWNFTLTPDNGFITVGSSKSNDGDVIGNIGSFDFLVIKLGPDCLIPEIAAETTYNVCSGQAATISAVSEGNTINWYASQAADEVLFTGPDFITPPLSQGVSYWAEALSATGCNSERLEIVINIIPTTTAVVEFNYPDTICTYADNPFPNVDSNFVWGGTFTAPTGLSINSATGEIDLSASTAGTYIVQYTVLTTGCVSGSSDFATINITEPSMPQVSFNYGQICSRDDVANPVMDSGFTYGGTFSAATGLSIDTQTGVIDVAASDKGIYTVVYQIEENVAECLAGVTTEVSITIDFCKIQKGISPNGDELNDELDLSGLGVNHLGIFNRYGIEVYSRSEYTNEWHGQDKNGGDLPDGTYYFAIEKSDGNNMTGWVYINRSY